MKLLMKLLIILMLSFVLFESFSTNSYALTESEVQAQVDEHGKEAVTGNVLIWFLCAIAFLKISQKIDSFMSSLGINVGHSGGSMISEAMVAAKGISMAKNFGSGKGSADSSKTSKNSSTKNAMSGGLTGSVGHQSSAQQTGKKNTDMGNGAASTNFASKMNQAFSGNNKPVMNADPSSASSFPNDLHENEFETPKGTPSMENNIDESIPMQNMMQQSSIDIGTSPEEYSEEPKQKIPDVNGHNPVSSFIPVTHFSASDNMNHRNNDSDANGAVKSDNDEGSRTATHNSNGKKDISQNNSNNLSGAKMSPTIPMPNNPNNQTIPYGTMNNRTASMPENSSNHHSTFTPTSAISNNSQIGSYANGYVPGKITGDSAAEAISTYIDQGGQTNPVNYSSAEIGNGYISATEKTPDNPDGIKMQMFSANKYEPPEGNHIALQAADGSKWYKQYATDAIEKKPYMTQEGKIQYKKEIVQNLPKEPKRKDEI